jgi:hypothetical protein
MTQCDRRGLLGAAVAAVAAPALLSAQDKPATRGKLTDESLGTVLKAMGLEAKLTEKRYDFAFKSTVADQDWDLSMSAVLSQDASSLWIMAWLDELPKSAADVPRTALLRLLSENDKMGKGKFFAYIASNRRFVLQRVIANENLTTAAIRAAFDDLGATVVHTYAFWSTANWSSTSSPAEEPASKSGPAVKGSAPKAGGTPKVINQAVRDTKFDGTNRK